jgi:hypothetical protein
MQKVTRDQNVTGFGAEACENPLRGVVWLEVARCRHWRKGVTGAPELLSCLAGAQLAAVPHQGRTRTTLGGFGGETRHLRPSALREGTPRIGFRSDSVAVVDEEQFHGSGVTAQGLRLDVRQRSRLAAKGAGRAWSLRVRQRTLFRRRRCGSSDGFPATESGTSYMG